MSAVSNQPEPVLIVFSLNHFLSKLNREISKDFRSNQEIVQESKINQGSRTNCVPGNKAEGIPQVRVVRQILSIENVVCETNIVSSERCLLVDTCHNSQSRPCSIRAHAVEIIDATRRSYATVDRTVDGSKRS